MVGLIVIVVSIGVRPGVVSPFDICRNSRSDFSG